MSKYKEVIMSKYKLPDGTDANCTLVQARRVWELCKSHLHPSITTLDDGILIRNPAVPAEPLLVLASGQVFQKNSNYRDAPPPMASEKPPEVSEFHRGVMSAIGTVWTSKFSTAPWTREVQDVLARASAEELRSLLELIARADAVSADAMEALERLKPPQPKSATEFTLNYCRGKLDTIKVAWAGRFSRALLDEHLDTLIDAMQRDVTSVDQFLTRLVGGAGFEILRKELDRLRSGV